MPDGAQAWKMIKAPGCQTGRIAQACDRCRSKKIKCDGLRPHCTQCLTVGFECKITDKLSRRAFPRGYTESLEDRIRQLEQDNNKLINLLDIKDEQLEMLARVKSTLAGNSPTPTSESAKTQATMELSCNDKLSIKVEKPASPYVDDHSLLNDDDDDKEYYVVQQINTLGADGSYMGSSSGGVMVKPLLEKLKTRNMGDKIVDVVTRCAHAINDSPKGPEHLRAGELPVTPPEECISTRVFSLSQISLDHLTTIYFQEWHSVFPVIDQSEFLSRYSDVYLDSTPSIDRVILHLVLSLAALATRDTKTKDGNGREAYTLRNEWKIEFTASLQSSPSLATAQALALALLYSLHTGNVDDIWHFRVMTVNMSQRLGLHRCHKSLRTHDGQYLTTKEQETRRRIFWTIYTLDSFAASTLGASTLIRKQDIECAMPLNDVDPTTLADAADVVSPAETRKALSTSTGNGDTKIETCSLAIIKFSQVLASILDTVYLCSKPNHSYRTIVQLEDQLESWRRDLVPNLKFELQHGKPTATLLPLHQKSPLLLMLYHHAKILIHMPALTGPTSGTNGQSTRISGSNVASTQSAKTYLQVYNYLNARHVTATLPLPQSRLCTLYGGVVLYGAMDYSKGGSLIQEVRVIINGCLKQLELESRTEWPGSISKECFHLLQETCETIVPGSRRKSSISSDTCLKAPEKSNTSSSPDDKNVLDTPASLSNLGDTPAGDQVSPLDSALQRELDTESAVKELLQLNGLWNTSQGTARATFSEGGSISSIVMPASPPSAPRDGSLSHSSSSLYLSTYYPLECGFDIYDNPWLDDLVKGS